MISNPMGFTYAPKKLQSPIRASRRPFSSTPSQPGPGPRRPFSSTPSRRGPGPSQSTIAPEVNLKTAAVQRMCSGCESEEEVQRHSRSSFRSHDSVQREGQAASDATMTSTSVGQFAAQGVRGSGSPFPYLDKIQPAFGRHDVTGIETFTGLNAAFASRAIGADAYTIGNRVAFDGEPSFEVAAHEAAHVIQQRRGVQLKGGVGSPRDAYEQHADAVAKRVVEGGSAEDLLDHVPSSPGGASPGDAVQGFGIGDIFSGISEGVDKITETIGDTVDRVKRSAKQKWCEINPESMVCIDGLGELGMELSGLNVRRIKEFIPSQMRGVSAAKGILNTMIPTLDDLMDFRAGEGYLSYSMYEALSVKIPAHRLIESAVRAIPKYGMGAASILSSSILLYQDYRSNEKIVGQMEGDWKKYNLLASGGSDIMMGISDALQEHGSLLYSLGFLEGKMDPLVETGVYRRIGQISEIEKIAKSARSRDDMVRANGQAKIVSDMAVQLIDDFNQLIDDSEYFAAELEQISDQIKRNTKQSVRAFKIGYLKYIDSESPIRARAELAPDYPQKPPRPGAKRGALSLFFRGRLAGFKYAGKSSWHYLLSMNPLGLADDFDLSIQVSLDGDAYADLDFENGTSHLRYGSDAAHKFFLWGREYPRDDNQPAAIQRIKRSLVNTVKISPLDNWVDGALPINVDWGANRGG